MRTCLLQYIKIVLTYFGIFTKEHTHIHTHTYTSCCRARRPPVSLAAAGWAWTPGAVVLFSHSQNRCQASRFLSATKIVINSFRDLAIGLYSDPITLHEITKAIL